MVEVEIGEVIENLCVVFLYISRGKPNLFEQSSCDTYHLLIARRVLSPPIISHIHQPDWILVSAP